MFIRIYPKGCFPENAIVINSDHIIKITSGSDYIEYHIFAGEMLSLFEEYDDHYRVNERYNEILELLNK